MKRLLPTILLASTLLLAPGCAAAAAGAFATVGIFGYRTNQLVRDYDEGLERTCQATSEAFVDLGLGKPEQIELDSTRFVLKAKDTSVVIERHPGMITRVEIRVGLFDSTNNRRRALLVAEEISFLLE